MDKKTFEAMGKVLMAANATMRHLPEGKDRKELDKAINLVWYWKDEVAKDYVEA